MPFISQRISRIVAVLLLFNLLVVASTLAQTDTPADAPSDSGRILAWVADDTAPGRQGASANNQLLSLDPSGQAEPEVVLDLGTGITRVVACGNAPTSPDGSRFAFLVTRFAGGIEAGTLYIHEAGTLDATLIAEEINPIACIGNGTLQWSPDGSRYGYLSYPAQLPGNETPVARLRIYDNNDNSLLEDFENVVAFDFTAGGASFIGFFPDSNGLATEVGIFTYDGTADREVSTLRADENCFYNTASVGTLSDGRIATQLGYRCRSGDVGTQGQLYLVDPANRVSELVTAESSAGGFFAITRNNSVFVAPNDQTVFVTLPDGVSNQTTALSSYAVGSNGVTRVFDNFAVMPGVSDLPYDANNAAPVVSPDGRWLALVRNTGNNDATLNVFDMNAPELPPITFEAGDRGETIAWMAFALDSNTLYFVAGGNGGNNNALFQLDLATGSSARLSRGRYAQAALSPSGTEVAIMNWISFADDEAPYLSLERVDLLSLADTLLFEGGTVVDGEVTDQQFAYPLAWRP